MFERPPARILGTVALCGALLGLFVWYGAVAPAASLQVAPDEADVESGDHVRGYATIGGVVVDTDPVVIEVSGDRYVVRNAPPVTAGQHLTTFAAIESGNTLSARSSIVREPWEFAYMYAVSVVGALWVAARGLRHWTVDAERVALVARGPDRAGDEDDEDGVRGDGDVRSGRGG